LLESSGGGPGKPVGRVAHFQAPDSIVYLSSNFFRTLRPDETKVHSRFLAWRLLDLYRQPRIWNFQQQTTGIINLKTKDYLQHCFRLPEKSEQSRIAAVLDTVDEAIANTEAVIAKLRQVRAGLLHDLLTYGLDKNGQLRDPIAHPEQFQASPFGQIPNVWDIHLLDDLAIRGSGHTPTKDVPSYWNGGINWVSLADSDKLDHIYISETDKQISELGIENSSAVKHAAGTVILSRDAGIGNSAILAEEMAVSQHFIAWRCGKRLHNVFLYYWLQQNKPRFEAIAMGSTIKTIGLPYFKRLRIAVPPIEEQRKAANAMLASEATISSAEVELLKLHQLKSGLMTDLLTGRVRVPTTL
jgi:type I restriction enzyme S subunit